MAELLEPDLRKLGQRDPGSESAGFLSGMLWPMDTPRGGRGQDEMLPGQAKFRRSLRNVAVRLQEARGCGPLCARGS